MSPLSKSPLSKSASAPADLRGTNLYRVAIVGAASLKGKELAEKFSKTLQELNKEGFVEKVKSKYF